MNFMRQSIIIKIHFPIDKGGFGVKSAFYLKCTPNIVLVVR